MSPIKVRQIRAGLRAKGFAEEPSRDHVFYFLTINGKRDAIFTKVSHAADEVGEPLLGLMSKQLRLSKNQFADLVNCPMSAGEYLKCISKG